MANLEEVMNAIAAQAKGTQLLRDEFKKLEDDAIGQASFKKLEALVTDMDTSRKKLEKDYLADIEATKKLAEEASLKAGRRGGGGSDDGPSELQLAHKSAFITHMRNREDPGTKAALIEAEKALIDGEEKAIGSAAGSGAGVAVPTVLDAVVERKTADTSVMRGLVHTITLGTSDYKKTVNKGGANYAWAGAGDTRNETNKSDHYQAEPTMGTIYAYPEYQEEQLDDVFFDLEGELTEDVGEAIGDGYDMATLSGTGVKMPTGMLHTPPVAGADGARPDMVYQFFPSGAVAGIGEADKMLELVYNLKRRYRKNASWVMNDLTALKVRVLKDGDGRFLWADGLQVGQPDRLLGYGVNAVDGMPDVAANSIPMGFGDWKRAYTLVERHGLRVTEDMITSPGFKKWHIRKRVGGMPTNDDAAKFLRIG